MASRSCSLSTRRREALDGTQLIHGRVVSALRQREDALREARAEL
ncbi:MAG TPA: hypothetical protein VJY65_12670 [Chloroflexota bacterium]|jgi:hypothetical protein|nr:hypothetical protein [Chloroflexota bacterium]